MNRPFLLDSSQLSEKDLVLQEKKFRELLNVLMKKADEHNCIIRVIGSIAFRIKAPEYSYIEYRNHRYLTDIDFVTYSRDIIKVQDMFFSLGWKEDQGVLRLFGNKRRIFYHPEEAVHSDVFIDKLRFCHEISFKNRLEIDKPTISLIDLILEKLQIVEINKKDLIDIMILLRKYEISKHESNNKLIDGSYLAQVCARDWGWWKTATMNLKKIKQFSPEFLNEDDAEVINLRVDELREMINEQKKTLKWRLRSIIGERVKWYNEVEEVKR